MNVTSAKRLIESNALNDQLSLLYQDVEAAKARYIKACDGFMEIYGDREDIRI